MKIRPFRDGDTFATFGKLLQDVVHEIDHLDNEYVLKASPTELERHYISRVVIDPIELDAENYYIDDQKSTQLDVTRDFSRFTFPGQRNLVKGTALYVAVPFSGDKNLWRLCPSRHSLSAYPEIEVRDGSVVMVFSFPDDSPNPERLKSEIQAEVRSLAGEIGNLRRDVDHHNASAPAKVRSAVTSKLQKAQSAVGAVSALGIPIRKRDQAPAFAVPARRREQPAARPVVAKEKYEAEPFLDQREYEHVLGILKSMSLVIERSPTTFASLDEEAIRTHFLIQLNGHYDGSATGETFNAAGKTDILIRAQNRNVFIAECKFWRGPKSFGDAIDQLLGYLTWRDSKCALLVFNQTRDSSSVRAKMHEILCSRPEHRKTVSHDPNGDSRYILVKTAEPGREIHLCTMLFDVPKPEDGD